MALAAGALKDEKITSGDYEQMADYIRCKEYAAAIQDAIQIIMNSETKEEAAGKLQLINDYCLNMRYIVVKRVFAL